MKDCKKYIALFLFAGFSFPQVAKSVHYFVIPHYSKPITPGSHQLSVPIYDYHSCDYHLTGLNLILFLNYHSKNQKNVVGTAQIFFYSFDHEIELAFNFQLRGPPSNSKS